MASQWQLFQPRKLRDACVRGRTLQLFSIIRPEKHPYRNGLLYCRDSRGISRRSRRSSLTPVLSECCWPRRGLSATFEAFARLFWRRSMSVPGFLSLIFGCLALFGVLLARWGYWTIYWSLMVGIIAILGVYFAMTGRPSTDDPVPAPMFWQYAYSGNCTYSITASQMITGPVLK